MSMQERINQANARSRQVPGAIFKVILAWFLSAIILAVLVPVLQVRGVELRAWMAWAVIRAVMALCLAPGLLERSRRTDRR